MGCRWDLPFGTPLEAGVLPAQLLEFDDDVLTDLFLGALLWWGSSGDVDALGHGWVSLGKRRDNTLDSKNGQLFFASAPGTVPSETWPWPWLARASRRPRWIGRGSCGERGWTAGEIRGGAV